jgi:hypothetical protein
MNAPAAVGTAIALPSDPMQLMQLAERLALARLIPPHFQKSPADCWLVMSFCRNRNLDFLMVIGEVSVVSGRLFFSGKLTAALLNTSGYLAERLNYEYDRDEDGNAKAVVVTGRLTDETSPRTVSVHIDQVKTANKVWTTQPEQQLAYAGARIWGRRHTPEILMGLLFEGEQPIIDVTPTEVPANPPTPDDEAIAKRRQEHDTRSAAATRREAAKRETEDKPAEPTSGDQYATRWQQIMASASSADELKIAWNSERLLRNNIEWHDREQPARIKDMVTRRIEELELAAAGQADADDQP